MDPSSNLTISEYDWFLNSEHLVRLKCTNHCHNNCQCQIIYRLAGATYLKFKKSWSVSENFSRRKYEQWLLQILHTVSLIIYRGSRIFAARNSSQNRIHTLYRAAWREKHAPAVRARTFSRNFPISRLKLNYNFYKILRLLNSFPGKGMKIDKITSFDTITQLHQFDRISQYDFPSASRPTLYFHENTNKANKQNSISRKLI